MGKLMQIKWVLFLAIVALSFNVGVYADQLVVSQPTVHGTLGGGVFIFTPSSGHLTAPFFTFCLEYDEHINIGGTYYYSTGVAADEGGVGGPSPDPISIGTVWLYQQFLNNSFPTIMTSSSEQDALQNAFWILEEEVTVSSPESNPYINDAWQNLNGGSSFDLSYLQADSGNNPYDIGVVNLYSMNSSGLIVKNQSALAWGVPEPNILFLVGLGLLAVAGSIGKKKSW